MHTDARTLNTISKSNPTMYKRMIYDNQAGFTTGLQDWYM